MRNPTSNTHCFASGNSFSQVFFANKTSTALTAAQIFVDAIFDQHTTDNQKYLANGIAELTEDGQVATAQALIESRALTVPELAHLKLNIAEVRDALIAKADSIRNPN